MNIVILDDYQDAVRKLACVQQLAAWPVKVYTNTVKGVSQLAVRLRDAQVLVLIGERTVMLHQGRVVLYVSGEERARMDVPDLLRLFERTRGEELADDALLLG